MRHDVEIDRGTQPADEIAAFRGPVVIDHRRGDVIHIQAQSVAEEQDQQQRDDEGQIEAAEVPDEVKYSLRAMAWTLRRFMAPPASSG